MFDELKHLANRLINWLDAEIERLRPEVDTQAMRIAKYVYIRDLLNQLMKVVHDAK